MGASTFQEGALIEIEGKAHSLLRKVTETLWQLEESRTKRISERTLDELDLLYEQEKLIFISDKELHQSDEARLAGEAYQDIPDKLFEDAKVRRAYVMQILGLPGTRKLLIPVIKSVWEKLKKPLAAPNAATVLRWRAKFLNAGKDITLLVEGRSRKGNTSDRYPKEVLDIVDKAIETKYLTKERGTIQDALDYAQLLTIRENKLLPKSIQLPVPTWRLVKRVINAIPAFDKYVARYGRTAAEKKFRSVLAHRSTAAPLERAEIDHTRMDLFVIDEDTGLPLGRPWLTICIDDFTRCILGFHLSFEPPSYLSVARCLKNAFLPKASLKEQYPSVKNRWDAHGIMRDLVVDNGLEFHSNSLDAACYSVGTEIHYAPRKRAWFKGKVERVQGTLNRGVAHGTPGTTFSNIFEKDDYDSSKHAVITLSTLQEIVRIWIADIYHQKPHRTLKIPPAALWASSIAPEDILVPDNLARLDAILGRRDDRKLTHKGIELDGLLYNSPELTELRYRLGDKLDVEVSVDDSDIGQIIVFSPDKKRMFKVRALAFEYADGMTRWQHGVCKRFAKNRGKEYSSEGWLEAKETISELIANDLLHKRSKTRVKIARFKGSSKKTSKVTAQTAKPVQVTPDARPTPLLPEKPIVTAPRSTTPRPRFTAVLTVRNPRAVQTGQLPGENTNGKP